MNLLGAYIMSRYYRVLGKDVWRDMMISFYYPNKHGHEECVAGFFQALYDDAGGRRIRVVVPLSEIRRPTRSYYVNNIKYFEVHGFTCEVAAYFDSKEEQLYGNR